LWFSKFGINGFLPAVFNPLDFPELKRPIEAALTSMEAA
jgi:hypothetical protein